MSSDRWPSPPHRSGLPSNDSLDDLESSLDRALHTAENNYYNRLHRLASSDYHGPFSGAMSLSSLNSARNSDTFADQGSDVSHLLGSDPATAFERSGRINVLPSLDPPGLLGRLGRRLLLTLKAIAQRMAWASGAVVGEMFNEIRRLLKMGSSDAGLGDERYISPRNQSKRSYASNAVSNAKYNPATFIPVILYEQFKFFFNLYFLLVALSQIVPQLRIGFLSSYIVPLAFVLIVTMTKEASDDIARRRRDLEQNNELFEVLSRSTGLGQDVTLVALKNLKVGDLVRLHKDHRIPADMILIQSSDTTGEAFIKTDQLDGETDWKLRVACNATQDIPDLSRLIQDTSLIVGKPQKSIHSFTGKLLLHQSGTPNKIVPLTVDQTLWANTVLASGTAVGMIVYTGSETRQQLNTTMTGVKTGLLESEINRISKILCVSVFLLSVVLVLAQGFPLKKTWYIDILRYLILFSSIIPVSLRVNLDLAKSVYASQIQKDSDIPDTIVRTSTIPEDLGRIEYLLSDKTGTLTQNEMEMKKLHLGTVCYAGDTLDIVREHVERQFFAEHAVSKRKDLGAKVADLVLVLAVCHNVTPTEEEGVSFYQAASPDEVAIVKFCESVGLQLIKRDRTSITLLHVATMRQLVYDILYIFPFNSDTKRMGIVVKDRMRDEVYFMQKGADTVMARIVSYSDWLEEETSNMAREGLRTLVIGRKKLSSSVYASFLKEYEDASLSMNNREAAMEKVISQCLETDVELMGLTGVEDKLQAHVKSSIELLRNAGIKIWMLTGDKVETAKCVAISAKLISRAQFVHQITKVVHPDTALNQLNQLQNNQNAVLLIDGESVGVYMKHFPEEFFAICLKLPAVIACRCTPQQKADIAVAIKEFTGKRVCCIGDGGNDVSMIQCADVGVGIVGKEGKQASLAADFSIEQFHFLLKLLLWHGRNSYKRSAKLAQFIVHRGLIISLAQAIYSISSQFEPLALFQGWIMVGYSTFYTMAPVFLLTLDRDIDEKLTKLYPELYKELTLGKSLSNKTFFIWVLISLFQGSVIQLLAQSFQGLSSENFLALVSLSFTALVLNELFMVALTVTTWNRIMVGTIAATFTIYILLVPFLTDYFDLDYMTSFPFAGKLLLSLAVSLFPVWLGRTINRKLRPPSYAKVQQH